MKEQLISFDNAKLAKEKGFKYRSRIYNYDGKLTPIYDIDYDSNNIYYAPNQSRLQKWLREVHFIQIDIVSFYDENQLPLTKTNLCKPKGYFAWNYYSDTFTEEDAIKFETYEEALEFGLFEALKLIELT